MAACMFCFSVHVYKLATPIGPLTGPDCTVLCLFALFTLNSCRHYCECFFCQSVVLLACSQPEILCNFPTKFQAASRLLFSIKLLF